MNQVEQTKAEYEAVNNLFHDVYDFMGKLTTELKKLQMSNSDLCDVGFFCREIETLLDDLRKEVKARKELIGRIIAFSRMKAFIEDPSIDLTVRGKYATGSPDVKQQAELPKKGTPEYFELTDFFGVERSLAESGVLRLDWNAISDLVTNLAADGKKLPPGLGKTIPIYTTTYRRRGNNE